MDTNDYRRRIEQSVAKVQARRPRAAARRGAGDLHRVVSDRKGPAKMRAEALGQLTRAEGPDVVPQAALERLADPRESPVVRLAAIKLLQQKQFFSTVAPEWRPAFVDALRAAVREPRLRAAALEVLSLLKDRSTQELLLEGIRQPRRALVPVHEALRLLSTDIHADVIDAARKLTTTRQRRTNNAAFMQAVRILAADPGSVGKLEEVLANDAYGVNARRLAATALSHLSPDSLQQAAGDQPGPRRGSRPGKRAGAKAAARPTGALARHIDTLKRLRG